MQLPLIDPKKDSLLSPIRMEAMGVLVALLEEEVVSPDITRVTISQSSVRVYHLTRFGSKGYECAVDVTAFFYWDGLGNQASMPPHSHARMIFETDEVNVLSWKPVFIEFTYDYEHLPAPDASTFWLAYSRDTIPKRVTEFVEQFNANRPAGFSEVLTGHDVVIWKINPSD